MAVVTQSSMIPPANFDTVQQLMAAARRGKLRRLDGIITQVFVNGADIGSGVPLAAAKDIAYRFVIVGEDAAIDLPDPVKPYNRRGISKVRMIGASVGDPCEIVAFDGQFRLYVHEQFDPYGCDGQRVEA